MTKLTSENFYAARGQGLALIDFFADWCGPCKAQGPAVEALAGEWEGKALVAKVNVDEAPDVARDFNVMSIPTLIVFKDGQEVERTVGVTAKAELERMLRAHA